MNKQVVDQLREVGLRFYQKNAMTFDQTRQTPWNGWRRLLPLIRSLEQPLRVFDAGCGNGRFGIFLRDSGVLYDLYVGVDSNHELLLEASKQRLAKSEFREVDLLDLKNISRPKPVNFIALFGVMHHIPGLASRISLLQDLEQLLSPNGILSVSFWNFERDPRFPLKVLPWSTAGIEPSNLEPGDFLLNWQHTGIPRYFHQYQVGEIEQYASSLSIPVLETFDDDGRSGKLNHYVVWKK
jgi:tRNA (uracil-5-)-methyltransferase TRM9